MATNFIDGLLRPRQASIHELVDVLRDIHHGKTTNPPRAYPTRPGGSEPQLPSLVPRLILDSVARGVEDLARLLAPASDAATGSDDPSARRYRELRGRFDRLERDVRQHAETVDRLLNGNSPAPGAAAYQETLYLRAAQGARAAGRFRCANHRRHRVTVASVQRPFTMDGEPLADPPTLTLRPGGFCLEPETSREVIVEVDLAACQKPSKLETSIDLLMNDAVAQKLWIEIDVYA